MISRVRQIYFSPIHLGSLDSGWFPYHNTDKVTPYFENDVIKKLYLANDHLGTDYYGVFSHKFHNKHFKDSKTIDRLMREDEYSHDVYSFFRNKQDFKGSSKFNTFFDVFHPNLLEIGSKLIKMLFNEDLSKVKADRIYYNHWLAKSDVFDAYCREALLPAMKIMDNELRDLCWSDAKYNKGTHKSHLEINRPMTPERCIEVFGVPYYPHHAFVLERLPSVYFAIKGYTIKQL